MCLLLFPVVSWVKKISQDKKLQFSNNNCIFLTQKITGAQNFSFAPKSSQAVNFLLQV